MEKYTIIYVESGTKFARVETDDLRTLLNTDDRFANAVFIFEGWPKREGETASEDC